jgi:hypothetical protein
MDLKPTLKIPFMLIAKEILPYWHGNFIPKKEIKLNWSKVVDGTTSAKEWNGYRGFRNGSLYNPSMVIAKL